MGFLNPFSNGSWGETSRRASTYRRLREKEKIRRIREMRRARRKRWLGF